MDTTVENSSIEVAQLFDAEKISLELADWFEEARKTDKAAKLILESNYKGTRSNHTEVSGMGRFVFKIERVPSPAQQLFASRLQGDIGQPLQNTSTYTVSLTASVCDATNAVLQKRTWECRRG